MKKFAITAEGFELPDYVHAETEKEALLTWASTIVGVQITEIEQVGDPITEIEQD